MKTIVEAMSRITESIQRGKGTWSIAENPTQKGSVMFNVGALTALKGPQGGLVIVLGMGREQLRMLRDDIDEALEFLDKQAQ